MIDLPSTIAAAGGAIALIVGNGFVMKLVIASFRESMREVFLTKEAAADKYVTKEASAKDIDAAKQEIWERISDHVIEPINRISNRLDDLFKFIGHGQADGAR